MLAIAAAVGCAILSKPDDTTVSAKNRGSLRRLLAIGRSRSSG